MPVFIPYAVKCFDIVEFGIMGTDLAAQAFDMAVDGAVIQKIDSP